MALIWGKRKGNLHLTEKLPFSLNPEEPAIHQSDLHLSVYYPIKIENDQMDVKTTYGTINFLCYFKENDNEHVQIYCDKFRKSTNLLIQLSSREKKDNLYSLLFVVSLLGDNFQFLRFSTTSILSVNIEPFTYEEYQSYLSPLLSNSEIKHEYLLGNIIIEPYDENNLGPNSYDVKLGQNIYRSSAKGLFNIWDPNEVKNHWTLERKSNIILDPLERVLGHTEEFIGSKIGLLPMINTRSSLGRNYISTCLCSSMGNVGFFNRWTLEISNHSNKCSIPLICGQRVSSITFIRCEAHVNEYKCAYQCSNNLEELKRDWSPELNMLPKLDINNI